MSHENIILRDPATGSIAEIMPALGFNCHRLAVQRGGQPVELLWAHPHFRSGSERPSRSGVPILFPFPGRIPGQTLAWEGREYPLGSDDGRGNAIHGFCHTRPWRVLEVGASRLVGQFHAWRDAPELQTCWPADFCITATYELVGETLRMGYRIENPGPTPLPCGLGTHPYFRLPLGGGSTDECLVQLPVTRRWELANMLPTGQLLEVPEAGKYAAGSRFADLQLDDVFAGLSFAGDWCSAAIHDPGSGIHLAVRFDKAFRECVVFTPPHREAICIEPYTCVPGAMVLGPRGVDAGLRILAPGEAFQAQVEFVVT